MSRYMAKNKNNDYSFLYGFIIAAVVYGVYFLFVKEPSQNAHPESGEIQTQKDNQEQEAFKEGFNALQIVEANDKERKANAEKNKEPFIENIMINIPPTADQKGIFALKTNEKDTVFIIRDKLSNKIVAAVTLPKYRKIEVPLPVGSYTIEYAQGDGNWQGLNQFWGYYTQYYRSNFKHDITLQYNASGISYGIMGTALYVNEGSNHPDRINHKELTKQN